MNDENENAGWAPGTAYLVLAIGFLFLSGTTTAAFFMEYAGQVFAVFVGPALSPYIMAVTGFFVLDVAVVAWGYLRRNHGTTKKQMDIAKNASRIALIGALLATLVFILLGTSLDIGIYTADGGLTTLGQGLNYLGAFLIAGGIAANFWFYYSYANEGAEVKATEQRRELAAIMRDTQYQANKERARLTAEKTQAGIMRQLGQLTDQEAEQATTAFLAGAGASASSQIEQEETETVSPFQNGKPPLVQRPPAGKE